MRRAHDRDGVPPRAVAATMAEVSDNDDLQDTDAEESEEEENDGEVASVDDRNGWGLQDDGAGYIVNDGGLFCYEKYVSLTRRWQTPTPCFAVWGGAIKTMAVRPPVTRDCGRG